MKSHPFNQLSDTVCAEPGCGKRLKERHVQTAKPHKFCHAHWITRKRKAKALRTKRDAREARNREQASVR